MTTDSGFERQLGMVLAVGSVASTVLLAGGLALIFLPDVLGASPYALHTGVVVLMGTPIMRVVVSVIEYARRRDWLFVVVTLIVLLELAASVFKAVTG